MRLNSKNINFGGKGKAQKTKMGVMYNKVKNSTCAGTHCKEKQGTN